MEETEEVKQKNKNTEEKALETKWLRREETERKLG